MPEVAIGFLITLLVPIALDTDQSAWLVRKKPRRAVRAGCVCLCIVSLIAGQFAPIRPILAVAFLIPVYQLEMCALVLKIFRWRYGREMRMMVFDTIADESFKKDAFVSTVYLMLAVIIPLMALILSPR